MSKGFKAYAVYISLKNMHMTNKSYNILKHDLINKEHLFNRWNKKRKSQDGHYFTKMQSILGSNTHTLALAYATYWLEDPSKFYIHAAIDDRFEKFKQNLNLLKTLDEAFEADIYVILDYCTNKKMKLKEFLFGGKNVYHFKRIKISMNTMVILNEIFGLKDKLNMNNMVEEEHGKYLNIVFDKYSILIEKYLRQYNFKGILKNIMAKGEQ